MENNQSSPDSPPTKTSALAVWSIIFGGLCVFFWIFTGVPALVFGYFALSRIKSSNGALTGRGFAISGITAGYISIVVSVFLAAIVIPNHLKAKEDAQRNKCIGHLQEIQGAEIQWALANHKTDNDTPTWADLAPYLIEPTTCPAGGTYTLHKVGEEPTCTITGHLLPLLLPPDSPGRTN